MDFISALQVNAFSVFLAIAAVGFLFLLLSLFFGGIFDHFDGGLDHDVDHGGAGILQHAGDQCVRAPRSAPSARSRRTTGWTRCPHPAIGFAGGLVLATPIFLFARFLYSQQATSESRSGDLVGRSARVTVAIPAGGIGQIRCRVGEELIDKVARTRGRENPFPKTSPCASRKCSVKPSS